MDVHVQSHDHEHGRWTVAQAAAHAALRPHLPRGYVGFAETAARPGRWRELPTARATAIVNLGDGFGGLPAAFVSGLSAASSVVEMSGAVACVDLKLDPLGAHRLLGLPMHELAGRTVDAVDVLGPQGRRLVDRLRAASTWAGRFALLDDFLLRRLDAGPRPAPEIEHAWRRLVESEGRVAIGTLAYETGRSRRHLTARFREQVGLTPKRAARVLRFRGLMRRADAEERPDWARLAAACGYFDQAHLNRDFRQFAGTTPGDYLACRLPGGRLAAEPVTSVQDTAPGVA